mgnify:CR=1 FL=1
MSGWKVVLIFDGDLQVVGYELRCQRTVSGNAGFDLSRLQTLINNLENVVSAHGERFNLIFVCFEQFFVIVLK